MDYITIALIAIGIFLVNAAIGIAAWYFICTEDKDALDWFLYQVDTKGEFIAFVIYNFWPIGLYIWFVNRR